jgi:endonuclease YncB( thermonuclease family)
VALALGYGGLRLLPPAQQDIAGPARVIDGDSIAILGEELRLHGVDAPEYRQMCRRSGAEYPCGRESARQLGLLLRGQVVTCRWSGRDRYGRALARCRAGETDINAAMVRLGHAVAYGAHDSEEAEARGARRGLWAGEFVPPAAWRAANPR